MIVMINVFLILKRKSLIRIGIFEKLIFIYGVIGKIGNFSNIKIYVMVLSKVMFISRCNVVCCIMYFFMGYF